MAEAVCVPARSAPPGSPQAKRLCHLQAQSHWGGADTGKKKSCICVRKGASCPTLCDPVDCGLPGFSVGGFSRQEHWSVLANTGCQTLLEHCISCCPSCQPPEDLVLPEPLQPKQLHHLHTWASLGQTRVLQGSLRSKPRRTNHMQRWKENHS